ncbi:MAG TPA: SURF1 family protein [Hyphomicrobiaceae bacterium]|nr:SURF1 family protein [Hyphomicrobiaceae bacterium]
MLYRLRQSGLIWPTLFALAGVIVLVGLGIWQIQRKQWKEGLIASIAARVHAEPVPLARAVARARSGDDIEYLHVVARGGFDHTKERYLYAPAAQVLGWHVYTPLALGPGSIVWVNRGFVPDARKAPASRAAGQVAGEVEVRGLVRLPRRKGLFTPRNEPDHNLWYWPDIGGLTASAFKPGTVDPLPLTIEADATPAPPGGLPQGGVTRIELPNRHLEYAATWFGLALTLIGVYTAFAATRLRAAPTPPA